MSLVQRVVGGYARMSRAAGVALLTLGTLLVVNRPLIGLIDVVHDVTGW